MRLLHVILAPVDVRLRGGVNDQRGSDLAHQALDRGRVAHVQRAQPFDRMSCSTVPTASAPKTDCRALPMKPDAPTMRTRIAKSRSIRAASLLPPLRLGFHPPQLGVETSGVTQVAQLLEANVLAPFELRLIEARLAEGVVGFARAALDRPLGRKARELACGSW